MLPVTVLVELTITEWLLHIVIMASHGQKTDFAMSCLPPPQSCQVMSEEEFSRHKAALASNKLQTDMSLGQEGDRAWEQVGAIPLPLS